MQQVPTNSSNPVRTPGGKEVSAIRVVQSCGCGYPKLYVRYKGQTSYVPLKLCNEQPVAGFNNRYVDTYSNQTVNGVKSFTNYIKVASSYIKGGASQIFGDTTGGGLYNVLIGTGAGRALTGQKNVLIGDYTCVEARAINNTVALGVQSGPAINYTGDNNFFLGYKAGYNMTGGSRNVHIGQGSGISGSYSDRLFIGNPGEPANLESAHIITGHFDTGVLKFPKGYANVNANHFLTTGADGTLILADVSSVIPAVNDGILTIKNGENLLGTFTANQENNSEIDISSVIPEIPTLQQVTDVGYTTTNKIVINASDANNPSLVVMNSASGFTNAIYVTKSGAPSNHYLRIGTQITSTTSFGAAITASNNVQALAGMYFRVQGKDTYSTQGAYGFDVVGATGAITSGDLLRLTNNSSYRFGIDYAGNIRASSLTGTTIQMVVASTNGTLSTQAIPTGTLTSITAGNGMNFTAITSSGAVTLGTPSSITLASANSVTAASHTHAFAPGGTAAQYITGAGTLVAFPAIPTVNNGTLTLSTSGIATGSATFTANQATAATFTVNVPATLSSFNNDAGFVTSDTNIGNTSLNIPAEATRFLSIDGTGRLSITQTNGANLVFFASTPGLQIRGGGSYNASLLTTSLTALQTYTFPDQSGTFALTSDIPSLTGYVPALRTIAAGNGLTGGGDLTANRAITLGTPTAITLSSANAVTTSSHTHAFTPGGTTSQYIRGNGTLATFPAIPAGTVTSVGMTIGGAALNVTPASITNSGTFALTWAGTAAQYVNGQGNLATFPAIPAVNDGTLTLATSGIATGSQTFTANSASNKTFTVDVPANLSAYTNDPGFITQTDANDKYTRQRLTGAGGNTMTFADTRNTDSPPSFYYHGLTNELKSNSVLGISGSGLSSLITMYNWADETGYAASGRIAVNLNGIYYGGLLNSTTWKPMKRLAFDDDVPTVNDAIISIKNGAITLGSFTTNQGTAGNIDISSAIPSIPNLQAVTNAGNQTTNFIHRQRVTNGTTANPKYEDILTYGYRSASQNNISRIVGINTISSNGNTGISIFNNGGADEASGTEVIKTLAGNLYFPNITPSGTQMLTISTNGIVQSTAIPSPGVTSVGMTIGGAALNVSPASITGSGTFALTWAGTAAQYVNGLGNLVTFPAIPTVNNGTLTLATSGIATGSATFTANQATAATFTVNVPATLSSYTNDAGFLNAIPIASASVLGGIKVGPNLSIDGNGILSATNTTYTSSTSIALSGTSFQRAALTGDITASANSNTTTIAANAVSNTKLADMAANTFKGRLSSAGDPQDLTVAQVQSLLGIIDEIVDAGDGSHYGEASGAYQGWQTTGGFSTGIIAITSNYSVAPRDRSIILYGSNTITLTLPDPTNFPGRELFLSIQLTSSLGTAVAFNGYKPSYWLGSGIAQVPSLSGGDIRPIVNGKYYVHLQSDGSRWMWLNYPNPN